MTRGDSNYFLFEPDHPGSNNGAHEIHARKPSKLQKFPAGWVFSKQALQAV
jgi:hypothetical protein